MAASPGKGHKFCRQCKVVIAARHATCPQCKFEYPFKGKARATSAASTFVMAPGVDVNADDFRLLNEDAEADTLGLTATHSSFMRNKPSYLNLKPQQKQAMSAKLVDSYIGESQLLLDSAMEQLTDFGDLESSAKILGRALTNLTYLATLCDAHQEFCD